jgi:hypothetical protein
MYYYLNFSDRGDGSVERKAGMVDEVYVWEVQGCYGDATQVSDYLMV